MPGETLTRLPDTDKNLDPQEASKLNGSLERKIGRGYNVLAEVETILRALERSLEVDQNSRDYVLENELTAACEAVDSGRYFWSSYRPWDPNNREFLAFGTSFRQMLRAGIEDMRNQVQSGRIEYAFELDRRIAELGIEEGLIDLYQLGELSNKMLLTISPYPEEISPEVSSSLGYKPKEQLGKLRFEIFINNVRQTIELSVANGSLNIFKTIVEEHGSDPTLYPNTTSFLERPLQLGDSNDYLNKIIDFAKRYDALLEAKTGIIYFCGKPIGNSQDKNYESVIDRQRIVREKGKPLIEWMYQVNLELAKSLHIKKPNTYVIESSQYWISVKDKKGEYLLPLDQRMVLAQVINTNSMSREAAFVLKKNELVRMWTVMACLINEERAKEMFSIEQVRYFRDLARNSNVWSSRSQTRLDQMIAQADLQFLVCGGLIESFGSMFKSPLDLVKKALFGEKRILCCRCFFCKKEVQAEIENGRITCPKCGESAPYTEQ